MEGLRVAHRAMMTSMLAFLRSEKRWRYLLSFAMAAVFLIAGVMKMSDPAAFTDDILRYRMLSETWSTFLAASLPWFEILLGVAIFCRPFRLTASFLMFGLLGIFSLAVAIALARGIDITCGCFGKAFQEYAGSGISFLLRDMCMLGISGMLLWLLFKKESPSNER